jgi:hypothetical protein
MRNSCQLSGITISRQRSAISNRLWAKQNNSEGGASCWFQSFEFGIRYCKSFGGDVAQSRQTTVGQARSFRADG